MMRTRYARWEWRMRILLLCAGALIYVGGFIALLTARDFALDPPWPFASEEIPTPAMQALIVIAIIPAVTLIFLGMVLPANPRLKLIDACVFYIGFVALVVLFMMSAAGIT